MADRYNRYYKHGEVTFYLGDHAPDMEESRFLILKVMEQAIRDYLALEEAQTTHEVFLWQTAAGFIFDDDYRLMWGDQELSPEDLLGMVDINISWLRQKVRQKAQAKGV